MSSRFFTNEESNTLRNRINNILTTDRNIEYLDFLIGYFRITGFHKISYNLSSIKKTRILVGINADRESFNASQLIQKFSKEQIDIYNREPLALQEYHNFQILQELIIQNRIEIRISPTRDIHSKIYIIRSKELPNHQKDGITFRGSVIIGSSNLTHNGLEGHREINAELNQERDIIDALKIFNRLWEESTELTREDFNEFIIPNLKEPTPTPHQLYIKLLIEHFGERIDFIDDKNIFVPHHYKKLSYQVEAVNDGLAKLREHNGFFLSDVVGLGKTVVVTMLIKKLKDRLSQRVLVVIPPAVRTQWEDIFNDFKIECCDVVSLASLDKVVASHYEMVVVDESHKFKNSESKRYKQLYKIALNKKVILLSATPQNNTPRDLYNQIALFQNIKNSTLPNCKNLQSFFVEREKKYREIINNQPIDNNALKNISEEIRDNILRTVMIRRTRYDIEHHNMYRVDIEKQGLSIPKVNPPIEHKYKLEGEVGKIFDNTAIKITQKLNYSRFNLLYYLTPNAQEKYYPNESKNIFVKNPLAGLMKVLLVKRFESSFSAFKSSINRHLKRYEKFIENYKSDIIYLGEMATDILDFDAESDEDYDIFIQNLIEKGRVKQLKRADFREGFESNLKSDLKIFQELVESWREVEDDPKLDKFREILAEDRDKKVVIFTESVDTLNYLKSKLYDTQKILFITSQNRNEKKLTIQQNFDANYDKSKQRDDYSIIITTDTLAEGINLHRSSIIYNYDIPWNSTKLIQRIGRVNRIGTEAEFISIHNFKPASHIERLIELSQKAFVKLQSSHTMMGEDSQIYTRDEQVSSVNLFDSYKQESLERDEELVYLEELRDFRDSNPKEFMDIKELKEGLTITRRGEQEIAYVVLDINGHNKYLAINNDKVKPISFMEIAEVFRADRDERSIKGKSREDYLQKAIGYFEERAKIEEQDKAEVRVDSQEEQTALLYLEEWYQNGIIDDVVFDKIEDIILNRGDIFMAKSIIKSASSKMIKADITNLIENYSPIKELDSNIKIKIIMSEIFKGKR